VTDITEFILASHDRICGLHAPAGGGARYAAASLTWMSRGVCLGKDPESFFPIGHRRPSWPGAS